MIHSGSGADSGETESPGAGEHDIGVLFVHGMGEQPEADTLLRFGEPVAEWIARWAGSWMPPDSFAAKDQPVILPRPCVRVDRAVLADDGDAPAHAVMQLKPPRWPKESGLVKRSWLLAESHWAADFRKPGFARLAGWMLTVGSWAVLSHGGKYLGGRDRESLLFWPAALIVFPLFAVLAALVSIAVVVLLILSGIPIRRLRESMGRLLTVITGSVGDAYVLLKSPFQRAAAVSRIRRHISWLSKRCRKVAVVAHSQGAAMAHAALQDSGAGKVDLFATLGSGLKKLTELEVLESRHRKLMRLAGVSVPLFTISLFLQPWLASMGSSGRALGWALTGTALFFVFACFRQAYRGLPDFPQELRSLSLAEVRPGLRWVDYHSTADFVPNGAMGDGPGFEWIASRRTHNLASLLLDHTSYWQNEDEFISGLVRELDSLAESGLVRDVDPKHLSEERRGRVSLLFWLRFLTSGGLLLSLLGLGWGGQLGLLGRRWVLEPGGALPGVGPLVERVAAVAASIARSFPGLSLEVQESLALAALGALVPLAAYLLCKRMAVGLWSAWNGAAMAGQFHESSAAGVLGVLTLGVALPVAALLFSLGLMTFFWPQPSELVQHPGVATVLLIGVLAFIWVARLVAAFDLSKFRIAK